MPSIGNTSRAPSPESESTEIGGSPDSGSQDEDIETRLSVAELKTVEPGPQEIWAEYLDADGTPVRGATVTLTGASKCLPIVLVEGAGGRLYGVLDMPADSDGMRDTVQVTAFKPGFVRRTAYLSYFVADDTWVVRNDHVERQLLSWASDHRQYVSLEHFTTFEGYWTYAVTLTDSSVPDTEKVKVMFTQSHAHEPGGTAATMDAINQVLTGETQEGKPTSLDRQSVLGKMLIVFIPIGNASGRERCPVQYWCEQYDREAMNSFIYGKLATDSSPWTVSPSVLHRREHELDPAYPIPLRYE